MEERALDQDICERVVASVHGAAGYNVNVMGPGGLILASSDPARVGTLHEGARRIMAGEVEEIAIDPETAARMSGVRPGFNGAVRFRGRTVACIGISGDPAVARPLQRMAALLVVRELERRELELREAALMRDMGARIGDIAGRMQVLSLNGSVLAARLGERGKGFKIVVAEMRKLAEQIQENLKDFG